MKKILLLSLLVCFTAFAYSQNKSEKLKFMQNYYAPYNKDVTDGDYVFEKEFNPVVHNKSVMDEDIVIGNTRYDLQTNYAIQNRIYRYEDGTIGATWTQGFEDGAGYPGRGTGYNYYDGSDWLPPPTERIESVRTGWPSYAPYGENGEIVVAHDVDYRLVFNWRENKGEGDWNEFFFEGPEGATGLWWPRMITSGENRDTIHVIALTLPTGNGGTIYEGQDGAIVYSRSADGGATWDPHNVILEGTGSDYYPAHSADIYGWAEPRAGTLAFFIFKGDTDGIILKSEDGGSSWEKITFMEFPWGGGPVPDDVPKYGASDANTAMALDNEGKAHLVFGRMIYREEGGSGYYYPYTNGLVYWNEDKPDVLDTTKIGSDVVNPTWLEENGYLAFKLDNVDSLAGEFAAYYISVTSMPQIAINEFNNVFVSLSAMTPGFENDGKNYRHVWGVVSPDNGNTWDLKMDYTGDLFHLFSECVYGSLAPAGSANWHVVYQTGNLPGIAARFEQHEVIDNNIVYLPIPNVFDKVDEIKSTISYLSQNYPNPCSNETYIQVNTLRRDNLKLIITSLTGKKVAEIDKGIVDEGVHYFNPNLEHLPSGTYLYTVYAGQNHETRKLLKR